MATLPRLLPPSAAAPLERLSACLHMINTLAVNGRGVDALGLLILCDILADVYDALRRLQGFADEAVHEAEKRGLLDARAVGGEA